MSVKAIPDGYTAVSPVFNIKGCADALEFYKQAFGAEQHGGVMQGPDGAIMHAELRINGAALMFSEAQRQAPTASSTHLYVNDAAAAWKRAVDAGAKVEMDLAEMFWGDIYGIVSDRWGNRWAIAQHVEDVSPDNMKARVASMMEQMAKHAQKT